MRWSSPALIPIVEYTLKLHSADSFFTLYAHIDFLKLLPSRPIWRNLYFSTLPKVFADPRQSYRSIFITSAFL